MGGVPRPGGETISPMFVAVIEQAKSWLVQGIASGKSYEVEPGATAFFLDSKQQLWTGMSGANGAARAPASIVGLASGNIFEA